MAPYAKTSPKEWEDRFTREGAYMPFGSICNLIGQAIAGKGLSNEQLISLTDTAYAQAKKFIKDSLTESKVEKGEELDIL